MIHYPAQDRYYGNKNDGMPPFGQEQILNQQTIDLVIDWCSEW